MVRRRRTGEHEEHQGLTLKVIFSGEITQDKKPCELCVSFVRLVEFCCLPKAGLYELSKFQTETILNFAKQNSHFLERDGEMSIQFWLRNKSFEE